MAGLRAGLRRSRRWRRCWGKLRARCQGWGRGSGWSGGWRRGSPLRASTSRGYAAHVRGYLVPYLGGIPLAELSPADVQGMFTTIIRGEAALGSPVSAATLRRIHATLRAALNAAVRTGLISVNPGRWPELPPAVRPRPQVWTPAMTARWEQEGWRPVVGVWTAEQTAQFLQLVRGHRLYALFHLVALRGLRRGEAAGLRWADLDLAAGTLMVTGQLQQLGGRLVAGPPKSEAGWRVVALDRTTIAALRAHHARQQAERAAAGAGWAETGYVFTTRTGKPVGPDRLTRLFRRLVAESGLPPVTLHGLRHGAATLALAAGTDLKIVQDQLGHSTIALTADTYTKARELHQPGEVREVCPSSKNLNAALTAQHRSFVTWDYVRTSPSDARSARQAGKIIQAIGSPRAIAARPGPARARGGNLRVWRPDGFKSISEEMEPGRPLPIS